MIDFCRFCVVGSSKFLFFALPKKIHPVKNGHYHFFLTLVSYNILCNSL